MDKLTAFGAGYLVGGSESGGGNNNNSGCLTFIWFLTFPIWGPLLFLFFMIGPYGAMVTHNKTDSWILTILAFFGSYIGAIIIVVVLIYIIVLPFKLFWAWIKKK